MDTLQSAGWSKFSTVIGGAMYHRRENGVDKYRDVYGEPCEMEAEKEPEKSLKDEAHEAIESASEGQIARLLMGRDLDKPTLLRLTNEMPIEDVLSEYGTSDIKRWLSRIGVNTKSTQREQLVEMVSTALESEK